MDQSRFATGYLVWFQYADQDRWSLASGTSSLIGAKMRCTNIANRMTAGGEHGRALVTSLVHFPDGSVESSMVYARESRPAPTSPESTDSRYLSVSDWFHDRTS